MSSDYAVAKYSEDALPQVISPEGAEIANCYLANACSIVQTSAYLGIPSHEVSAVLDQPLVKNYVYGILKENGYRHMIKISEKLDTLIEKKLEELEEAEIGSNKDIADLLHLAHKMRVDMATILQKDNPIKQVPSSQTNTQVNVYGEGSYGRLMEKLING